MTRCSVKAPEPFRSVSAENFRPNGRLQRRDRETIIQGVGSCLLKKEEVLKGADRDPCKKEVLGAAETALSAEANDLYRDVKLQTWVCESFVMSANAFRDRRDEGSVLRAIASVATRRIRDCSSIALRDISENVLMCYVVFEASILWRDFQYDFLLKRHEAFKGFEPFFFSSSSGVKGRVHSSFQSNNVVEILKGAFLWPCIAYGWLFLS